MATTDSGFQFVYNLAGRTSGIARSFTIADNTTITIGDAVKVDTDGYIVLSGAGGAFLGFVVGLVDANGIDMNNSKATISSGGSYTDSTKTVVTSTSANESTDLIKAVIDIDPFSVWTATPDTAAIGTTTSSGSSDQLGSYTDMIAASDQPDENNGGNAYNSVAQLFIWGTNPSDTAKGLYTIAEHQIWGQ